MMGFLRNNFSDFPLLVRYGVSGLAGYFTNILVIYCLTDLLGVHYILSAVLSFVVAFAVTFTMQKYWTFRDASLATRNRQVVWYLIITLGSLGINVLLLYIFVDIFGLWYLSSQFVILGFIALISFLLNKKPGLI